MRPLGQRPTSPDHSVRTVSAIAKTESSASSTRRHDVQRPLRKKGQTCTPGCTACTREEHLHHSHNTHRRSFVLLAPHALSSGPVLAQVLFVGRRGHGCHWQVPQCAQPVVLQFHDRKCSHQQRVRQAEVCLHRAFAAHPRPVHEAWRAHPHRRLQKGAER